MLDLFGLKKYYRELLNKNFYKFLLLLGLLACSPLIASSIFDYLMIGDHNEIKTGIVLGVVLVLLFLLLSFISIALWASIKSKVAGERRMILIISSYLMIWLAFSNIYYFFSDTENYVFLDTSISQKVSYNLEEKHIERQRNTILKNVPHFWEFDEVEVNGTMEFVPKKVNRWEGFIDCLYFSGVSIMTIGYGDIVPASRFIKMLVLLEGFLGQFMNVVAVGLWLSGIKSTNEEDE